MFSKLLGLLAWAGLWQPQLVVLNSNNPPSARLGTNATEMVHTTSRFMDALVESFVSNNGQKVSYMALEHSTFYRQSFSEFGTLLHNTNPLEMNQGERKAFFINLYNILTIHSILHHDPLPESTISVPNFWSRYAYKVGPYLLHLDHIEHGILRGNRAHPSSGNVMFSHDDPRMALSLLADRRIHGALNCGAMSCPPLKSYDSDKLEVELNAALSGFCNRGVKHSEGELIINSIFQWFRVDFGATEPDALRWLAECVDDQNTKQALRQAALAQRDFSYDYNWNINAVSVGNGGKVKVEVYFSSLCSDSVNFFTRQLYPTWLKLQDIMDLHFYPYGKARATPTGEGDYAFQCQHGPDECHGNKVMACIQNSLPVAVQVDMLHCMMSKSYPAYSGQQCSQSLGLDWTPIQQCAGSPKGSTLLYKNGARTADLKPRVYFIPTITVDGHYDRYQLRSSLMDLKSQICSVYQGPPHEACV